MGWFHEDAYNNAQGQSTQYNADDLTQHEPSFVHELIAGAASYEAMKAYENHVAQNGEPDSHAKAKELMAGFAGAFVDREFETRGLDFVDREKAKYEARKRAEQAVAPQDQW